MPLSIAELAELLQDGGLLNYKGTTAMGTNVEIRLTGNNFKMGTLMSVRHRPWHVPGMYPDEPGQDPCVGCGKIETPLGARGPDEWVISCTSDDYAMLEYLCISFPGDTMDRILVEVTNVSGMYRNKSAVLSAAESGSFVLNRVTAT